MDRPQRDEYDKYYGLYVDQVGEGDILGILDRELETTVELLGGIDDPAWCGFRYAAGKWTLNEVVGHLVDTERAFGFRAFWIARLGTEADLPGMDQDDFAREAPANERTMASLLEELGHLRRSHLSLFRTFDDAVWRRRGKASGCEFSVRALAYVMAGHEIHHRRVIEERYLAALGEG